MKISNSAFSSALFLELNFEAKSYFFFFRQNNCYWKGAQAGGLNRFKQRRRKKD